MRTSSILTAVVVLMLAPLPLLAQGGNQRESSDRRGEGRAGMMSARLLLEHGSVQYLVGRAADLTLTAEQTASLAALGETWAAATKDLRDEIRAAMPARGQAAAGDRREMMERMQALRPALDRLVEEDRASLEPAMALLDQTQRDRALELLEERTRQGRPPRDRR